jgi:hypothetical protein
MRKISMSTNLNSKLSCDHFLHIAPAPPEPIPESKLNQFYQIEVLDQSHPPVEVELLFFNRFKVGSAVDVFTMPSHGMDAFEFINFYLAQNPAADLGTELAVYYYKKNKNQQ